MLDEFIHLVDFCMLLLLCTEQCVHAPLHACVHTPIHILSGMPLACLCKPYRPPKNPTCMSFDSFMKGFSTVSLWPQGVRAPAGHSFWWPHESPSPTCWLRVRSN